MQVPQLIKTLTSRLFRFTHLHSRLIKDQQVSISLSHTEPVNQVAREYLSFSIDISVLVGGYWWEGSTGVRRGLGTLRVPPIDLTTKKLDRLVQSLGPAYLRIGGSEADKIHYFECPKDEPDSLVLTTEMWDKLHAFIQRNQLKLVFTFKYGLFERSQHGNWQGSEIKKLLDYSQQQGYSIDICELGNELNAYWAFHGLRAQPGGKNLAADYATFSKMVKSYFPHTKVMGPGSAYWPKLGESVRVLPNLTKRFLQNLSFPIDIVSWHYYPFQSTRSPVRTRTATLRTFLSPKSYQDFKNYSQRLRLWINLHQPQAEFWTGETGSAQCGGEPELSDRFVSSLWWAEQLGNGALLGQKVMIRQSLIGGDYGMINRLTLKPRSDYWVSWLWAHLMGQKVYAVNSTQPRVKAYCHQHPDQKHKTLLLVNLGNFKVNFNLSGFGELKQKYVLSANKIDAKRVYINGEKARFKKGKVSLEKFAKAELTPQLKPFSITFLVLR